MLPYEVVFGEFLISIFLGYFVKAYTCFWHVSFIRRWPIFDFF